MFSLQSLHAFRNQSCNPSLKTFVKIIPTLNHKINNHDNRFYCSVGGSGFEKKNDDPIDTNQNYAQRIPRRFQKRQKYLKEVSQKDAENYNTLPDARPKISKMLNESRSISRPNVDFPSDLEDYTHWKRNQDRHAFRPKVDPVETSIILFPGQGSQFVGMGEKLLVYPGVKELYETASRILRYDLLSLCINGPSKELNKTEHCQPAVFVTSLAAVEKLREEHPEAIDKCVGTAGFSVGEFAALVFAGVMTFEEALHVVKVRAKAMQIAAEDVPSGMMTVFGHHQTKLELAMRAAREFCEVKLGIDNPVCHVANYLFTDCKVIAGHQEALDFIRDNAKDFGITRIKQLPVSGAFHTSLMKSAQEPVRKALDKIEIHRPSVRVHSNIDGKGHRMKTMKNMICRQIVKPVKWEQTLHILYCRPQGQNFPHTYEVGPGKQLGTMLKTVNLKAYSNYKNITV